MTTALRRPDERYCNSNRARADGSANPVIPRPSASASIPKCTKEASKRPSSQDSTRQDENSEACPPTPPMHPLLVQFNLSETILPARPRFSYSPCIWLLLNAGETNSSKAIAPPVRQFGRRMPLSGGLMRTWGYVFVNHSPFHPRRVKARAHAHSQEARVPCMCLVLVYIFNVYVCMYSILWSFPKNVPRTTATTTSTPNPQPTLVRGHSCV